MADEKEVKPLKKEIVEKLSAFITAAFGLVAALAWNGAIQAAFKQVFGNATELVPMLIYAVVVSIVAIMLMIWIARVVEKLK